MQRLAIALAAFAASAALAGCGLGAGKGTSDVSVTVTRGFGSHPIATVSEKRTTGSETVMRMLERSFKVQTQYGGGFVEAINGHAGDSSRRDWFYYVNGVEAAQGAASTTVHQGDRIWWDLHDWSGHRHDPCRRRLIPRAVRARDRWQALPDDAGVRRRMTTICKRVAAELHAVGVPSASR